ncbi:MAG: CBS domain-containing protein, partial [Povalibacter sp.]
HHIPIIDADKRLVGVITQSDFVRALYRTVDPLPQQITPAVRSAIREPAVN